MALLDLQKNALNDTLDRISRYNTEAADRFMRMSTEAITKIGELTTSLDFAHHQLDEFKPIIDTLRRENNNLHTQIETLTLQHSRLEKENIEMKEKIDYLDDYGRRQNLRINGLPEGPNETWEQSQAKVTSFLQQHFNVSPDFERVHRVGNPSAQRSGPRDVVARFARYQDREAIFQNRRKLASTRPGIYINEDLCPNTLAVRKAQMPAYHAARNAGQVAYFSYRKLVIKDRVQSVRPRNNWGRAAPVPSSPPPSPFLTQQGFSSPRTPPPRHTHYAPPVFDATVPPPNYMVTPQDPQAPSGNPSLASSTADANLSNYDDDATSATAAVTTRSTTDAVDTTTGATAAVVADATTDAVVATTGVTAVVTTGTTTDAPADATGATTSATAVIAASATSDAATGAVDATTGTNVAVASTSAAHAGTSTAVTVAGVTRLPTTKKTLPSGQNNRSRPATRNTKAI